MKLIIKNSSIIIEKRTIVYKNYWDRTVTQYCFLRHIKSVLESLTFSQIKGSLEFYIDTSLPVNHTSDSSIIESRGANMDYFILDTLVPTYKAGGGGTSSVTFNAISESGVYELEFDHTNGTVSFNGETKSIVQFSPNSYIKVLALFAYPANSFDDAPTKVATYTSIKFKRLRLYNSSNVAIADIRPALVNGNPCLYDSVNESEIYSEDNTTMILS